MRIAVLSGKGGTGKTLVSVNLAAVAERAVYVDCDVEEPNGHLFFDPKVMTNQTVMVKVPMVNHDKCDGCRDCITFCKFNALAYVGGRVKVFESICHACGGCALICPKQAIVEKEKAIGRIETGIYRNVEVITGIMNTGEETGVPIVKQMLKNLEIPKRVDVLTVIDCPPGSSCMVMESIKNVDYCVLVAEPTTFGAHNLQMVTELASIFEKSVGCVLNKCLDEDNPSEQFCVAHGVPIIGRIPYDKDLGLLNSSGEIVSNKDVKYFEEFDSLLNRIVA